MRSHFSRCSSISVASGAGWASGATPPMAKPVCARTKSASALPSGSPTTPATRASSTRLAPLAITSSGRPLVVPRNTSDFAIWSTRQPTAAAASAEVRAARSRYTIVLGTPCSASAAWTRAELGGSSATSRSGGAQVAHLREVLEVVIGGVGRVLRQRDRSEVAGEPQPLGGARGQRVEELDGGGARAGERLEVGGEVAPAMIARAGPGVDIEGFERGPVLRNDAFQAGQEQRHLEIQQVRQHLRQTPLIVPRPPAERVDIEAAGHRGDRARRGRQRGGQLGDGEGDPRFAALWQEPERRPHVLDLLQVLRIVGDGGRRVGLDAQRAPARTDALSRPGRVVEAVEDADDVRAGALEDVEQRREIGAVVLERPAHCEDRPRL